MIDLHLTPGTWEDAEAMVGQEFAHQTGVDPVNRAMIRRQLEALEWDCPLFYDDDVAQDAGWPGMVAPYSMYMTFAMPAYWEPGGPAIDHPVIPPFPYGAVPAPGTSMMATDTAVEFHAPMRPGDLISSTWKLTDVTRKTTRVGDGAFMTFEVTYRNQDGDTVAVDRTTVFRYDPGPTDGD